MRRSIQIGDAVIGEGQPVYIAAEIGINHNGDLGIAKNLVDVASRAGCDAVKFQKRTPSLCVPPSQRELRRETPWGELNYLEYRERLEFGREEFEAIAAHCKVAGVDWFASAWDEEALRFLEGFDPPAYKVASACVTDLSLLSAIRSTGKPVVLSTGMSSLEQIDVAVDVLADAPLLILHCTSTYPCQPHELNLRVIPELARRYGCPIGYSGHEVGLPTTVAAVALGACYIERHATLDRAMWGSDQSASIEPGGLERLVRYIRVTEAALGDGVKRIYDSERAAANRLRRVDSD